MKRISLLFCLFLFGAVQAQQSDKIASVKQFQKKINSEFKDPAHSPLPDQERETFSGLDFFPIDTSFTVVAEFVRTPFEQPFEMETTTERRPTYVKYGEVYFVLRGKEYKLNLYQSRELSQKQAYRDYLFMPFTDVTNGTSSYAGGRYLDLTIPKTNRVVLDFNKAYNPYCAYSGEFSCPVPPEENHLELAVEAGVKAYKKK